MVYQRKWSYWRFWVAWFLCFVIHVFVMWVIFARVLVDVKTMGILIWLPAAFAEGVFFLGLIPYFERKVKHERRKHGVN